jgi:hypothetical protein
MEKWMNAAFDSEDEEIYIENRVEELMDDGEECDPENIDNLVEALSEASIVDRETMDDYIQQSEWEKLGLKIVTMSYNYMEARALDMEQSEVSQGAHL